MPTDKQPAPVAPLDPRFDEILRDTLAGTSRAAPQSVAEPPSGRLLHNVGTILVSLLVVGASLAALVAYYQIGVDLKENRKGIAALRESQSRALRRDEFNRSNVAINTMIREVPTTSDAALSINKERVAVREEQIKTTGDTMNKQLKEVADDLKGFDTRLEKVEKRLKK